MPVHIGEVSTTVESLPASGAGEPGSAPDPGESAAFEVRIEELRPLIRALVAEEIERWLRRGSGCP
jgi:hypothetical protein